MKLYKKYKEEKESEQQKQNEQLYFNENTVVIYERTTAKDILVSCFEWGIFLLLVAALAAAVVLLCVKMS